MTGNGTSSLSRINWSRWEDGEPWSSSSLLKQSTVSSTGDNNHGQELDSLHHHVLSTKHYPKDKNLACMEH
jgi:hypothetical protein